MQAAPGTANLQNANKGRRLTVAQIAAILGISERSIYSAKVVARQRPDLFKRVKAGDLTLHAAEREMKRDARTAAGAPDLPPILTLRLRKAAQRALRALRAAEVGDFGTALRLVGRSRYALDGADEQLACLYVLVTERGCA